VTRLVAPPVTNDRDISVVLNWFNELTEQVPPR
jgi:hypothetical protein